MTFIEFAATDMKLWDAFVDKSPDAWYYHTSEYITYAGQQEGNENLTFAAATDTNEIIGICPIYLTSASRYTSTGAILFLQRASNFLLRKLKLPSPWSFRILTSGFCGPALAASLGAKGRRKAFKEISNHLLELGKKCKADEIHLRFTEMSSTNSGENRPPMNQLWMMGFYDSITPIPRASIVIDLTQTQEKIRSGLDEDCRADINRAVKEGCTAIVNPEQKIERYHKIHEQSWTRTFGRSLPLSEFHDMEKLFKNNLHVLLACHKEKEVAGVMLHTYKDSVIYWGGSSLLEGQKVKANNFLLYEALKWTKEQGFKSFCVGVFESYPGHNLKEYTVGQYKAQFSNRHFDALEGRRILSKKALRLHYLERKQLLDGSRT